MSQATTLLELSGANLVPPRLKNSCLLIIDMQKEYLQGPLRVVDSENSIRHAANLLAKARKADGLIIHVAHQGQSGGLFDRNADRGQIIDELSPLAGEAVVEKTLPNAFAKTSLQAKLDEANIRELVIIGFMTHMCVSSTARAALDLGYRVTIDANCCSTRDLPDGCGNTISGMTLNIVALAELSDRFAIIARDHDW